MAERLDERIRCLHCVNIVMDIFPKILQKVMEISGILPQTLFQIIQRDNNFKKKLVQRDHHTIQTLLNDGYTKLDVTLIFKIITHFSIMFLTPPTRGWSSDPQPNEITIGDDAQRLRLMRNHFFHKVECAATEAEYNEFFEKVKVICERVDSHFNLMDIGSFTPLLQRYRVPPCESLPEIERQYTEQKDLKEFLTVVKDDKTLLVYETGSLRELLQELYEGSDNPEKMEPINLIFPKVTDIEFVTKFQEELKDEINKGFVNIKVIKATKGSLVLEISVRRIVLLDDEEFRKELNMFLNRLLEQKELQSLIRSQHIVMCEYTGFYDETNTGHVSHENSYKDCLNLHLGVKTSTLYSEEAFKRELQHLLEKILVTSKPNGNDLFKSDPLTAVLQPDTETLESNSKQSKTMEFNDRKSISYPRAIVEPKIKKCYKGEHKQEIQMQNTDAQMAKGRTHSFIQKKDSQRPEPLGLHDVLSKSDYSTSIVRPKIKDLQTEIQDTDTKTSQAGSRTHSVIQKEESQRPEVRGPHGRLIFSRAIVRPKIKESRQPETLTRHMPFYLHFQDEIKINIGHSRHYKIEGCCILPSGNIIVWFVAKNLEYFLSSQLTEIALHNSDGSFKSTITLKESTDIQDASPISDNHAVILCKLIYIINATNGTVVSSIDTGYTLAAIAYKYNTLILCVKGNGIIEIELEKESFTPKKLFEKQSPERLQNEGVALDRGNKRNVNQYTKGSLTKTIEKNINLEKHLSAEKTNAKHVELAEHMVGSEKMFIDENKGDIYDSPKNRSEKKKINSEEVDFRHPMFIEMQQQIAPYIIGAKIAFDYMVKKPLEKITNLFFQNENNENDTLWTDHFRKMVFIDEDISLRSRIAVGSERICYTCPDADKIKILDADYNVMKILDERINRYGSIDIAMDGYCNTYYISGYNKVTVISPYGEASPLVLDRKVQVRKSVHSGLGPFSPPELSSYIGIDYIHISKRLVVADKSGCFRKYSIEYD